MELSFPPAAPEAPIKISLEYTFNWMFLSSNFLFLAVFCTFGCFSHVFLRTRLKTVHWPHAIFSSFLMRNSQICVEYCWTFAVSDLFLLTPVHSTLCFTAGDIFDIDQGSLRTVYTLKWLQLLHFRFRDKFKTCRFFVIPWQMVATLLGYYFVVKQLGEDNQNCSSVSTTFPSDAPTTSFTFQMWIKHTK